MTSFILASFHKGIHKFPLKAGWTPEWCRLGDEKEFSAHVVIKSLI